MSPLPPSEIRRRGDRRRRRSTALGAVAAVAVVAVIATPLAVLAGGDHDTAPDPARPSPTASLTTTSAVVPAQAPFSADLLLTGTEVPQPTGLAAWQTTASSSPTFTCQPASGGTATDGTDGTDATGLVSNAFEAYLDLVGSVPTSPYARVRTSLHQYADARAAGTAVKQASIALEECTDPTGVDRSRMSAEGGLQSIDDGDDSGAWMTWSYPDDAACPEGCDATTFEAMGAAQIGDRVLLVSLSEGGGPGAPSALDESQDDTMRTLMTTAMIKARTGTAPLGVPQTALPTDTPSDVPTSGAGSTIPPGFPIDTGLTADTADGGEKVGPSTGLTSDVDPVAFPDGFCGTGLWPAPDGVERIAAHATGPTSAYTRELVTFATSAEAQQVVDDVRQAAQDCEGTSATQQDPPSYQVLDDTTGLNSTTFGYTFYEGLGGEVYQFTQLGNAVLVTAESDEFDQKSERVAARELTRLNQPLLDQACLFDGTC